VGYVGLADELPDSPFRGMIALPGKPDSARRVVAPAAVEASIAYIQSKRFKQLQEDSAVFDFFLTIWMTTKNAWPNAFEPQSKLLSKIGLVSMTHHIVDAIDFLSSYGMNKVMMGNFADVTDATGNILKLQCERFWLVDWNSALSDTKAVRDEVEAALKQVQQNLRDDDPWWTDLRLVKKPVGNEDR
jgi:hypothetical protein